ncbi:aldehyde dehydrogenase family protein [Tunturiibacter gelidoferens]|uniref:Aldehyde dehydrogenase family protein n=1 Tax=Tunturiibacter gelidiferens TaxID=3069689 RepID=A0AAU7Z0Q3_9BACT
MTTVQMQVPTQDFHQQASALRPETRMVIDGKLVDAISGQRFETVNPANDETLASVPMGGVEDVDLAVTSARAAFRAGVWSRLEPRARMQVMYRMADLITENALRLGLMDSVNVGKPIADMLNANGDVAAAALTFRFFGEAIDKVEGVVTTTAPNAFHYIVRQPIGVVACIAPWNYPLLIAAWKVAPALAIGNSVILKPAQISPFSATLLGQLFLEAGGPPGVLNIVHGTGGTVGKALALHPDVNKISFTGSTDVGKMMMVYSGQSNLKRVTVETGGKSPQIITANVPDLDVAVEYAVNGIYGNKGEMCSAGSRLLVDASIHDDFVERFKARTRQTVLIGDPLDTATTMGPLASRNQQTSVLSEINLATQEGAKLVLGGQTPEGFDHGAYVEPTLFTGVNNGMRIAREEVFGPVATVLPFETIDEAVAIANDSIYGLSASVWTSDVTTAHKVARDLEAGVVWVNCYDLGDMTQPWGGFKQSGIGRDKCLDTLNAVSESKSVWINLD